MLGLTAPQIVALVSAFLGTAGLGAWLGHILSYRAEVRKTRIDVEALVNRRIETIFDQYQAEYKRLQDRVSALEMELSVEQRSKHAFLALLTDIIAWVHRRDEEAAEDFSRRIDEIQRSRQ